jgi:hypothetical protein
MLPIEFALRAINAGLGLLGLLLLLNAGGLLREYALLLPVGFVISLLIDAGRSELVLKHGLREGLASAIPRKLVIAAAAGAASVLLALRLPVGLTAVVAVAVVLSAVAQVYVDFALRHCLYRRRSVLIVSWFQFACAAINALLAWAGRNGGIAPEHAVVGLVVTPALVALAVRRQLLFTSPPEDTEALGGRGNSNASVGSQSVALAFRIAPSMGYSVYLFALRLVAPPLEATARALYFVFGFLHLRTMARHSQGVWALRGGIMALVAVVISVPLLIFDRPTAGGFSLAEAIWATALLVAFSLAGGAYLELYEKFLKNR